MKRSDTLGLLSLGLLLTAASRRGPPSLSTWLGSGLRLLLRRPLCRNRPLLRRIRLRSHLDRSPLILVLRTGASQQFNAGDERPRRHGDSARRNPGDTGRSRNTGPCRPSPGTRGPRTRPFKLIPGIRGS